MRSCPVRSKHLPLEDIRHLFAELTELGYQVRFEVNGSFESDGKTGRFFTMMKTDG